MILVPFLCELLLAASPQQQVSRVCVSAHCSFLVVDRGVVRYIDGQTPTRDLVVGKYIGQAMVPKSEAPIRALKSASGNRVVISAFLDRKDYEPGLRARFLSPNGTLKGTTDGMLHLLDARFGHLLGGDADILALTTEWEHSYNVSTEIWYVATNGAPRLLVRVEGSGARFVAGERSNPAGIWINLETYSDDKAETKGWVSRFWSWDETKRVLTKQ